MSAGSWRRDVGLGGRRSWLPGLVVLTLAAAALRADAGAAQATTIDAVGDVLHVSAPGFHVLEGETLARLRDGRSLRIDLELEVLARPGGRVMARAGQTLNLSYDLWEERFAIARVGTPPRTVSHLTQPDAERWCLEQLTVPLREIDGASGGEPFWIRLRYRVVDPEERDPGENGTFTLFGLIDRLSRRRAADDLEASMEAGPFRLSD